MSSRIARIARQGITCIKNADNPYFNSKYADLGTVVAALKGPLEQEGLGYYFQVDLQESDEATYWYVKLIVVDVETDKEISSSYFPIQSMEPQKFGSNITYGKRYLLTTMFNVIAELDDDGNATIPDNKPKKDPKVLSQAKDFFK